MSQILPLIRRIAENTKAGFGDGRREKFFVFKFGAKQFAIPAVDVTEVVIPGSLITIPEENEMVMGVVNIRGTVVPVLNLRDRIGLEKEYQIDDDSRLMVFTIKSGSYVALIADAIEYRLKEGVLTSDNPALEGLDEKTFRCALIGDVKYHVFLIDQWITNSEIETLQRVVESF